ncbi:hypothetical protein ANN_11793 [Periplaneta americana]|uniref:Uncharacterized protein n=1 Tax=Periplaneta americana TaxID=6978 RepID=A0ABQ8T895_PERAM|nr:hypothetical protein ANN_11793 [Periplaneta americana]
MVRVKWTDRIRNEAVLERVGEERMILKLIKKRKRNWLGHWLRRNCLLKDALEEMVAARSISTTAPLVCVTGNSVSFASYYIFIHDMALLAEEMALRDMLLKLNDSCEQYRTKIKYVSKEGKSRESFELNELHQLLAYADDVNMLEENSGILLEANQSLDVKRKLEAWNKSRIRRKSAVRSLRECLLPSSIGEQVSFHSSVEGNSENVKRKKRIASTIRSTAEQQQSRAGSPRILRVLVERVVRGGVAILARQCIQALTRGDRISWSTSAQGNTRGRDSNLLRL